MNDQKKRRDHGSGGLRQRGKGSWELKVHLGRDEATGKPRISYVSFRGTEKQARQELARLISQPRDGVWADPGKMTLGVYLETWLQNHAATEVSAKTAERYGELLRLHVIPHTGAVTMGKLRPAHIQSLRAKLLTEGRRPRLHKPDPERAPEPPSGLSPQTVKHVYRVLRRALRQAVKLQLLAVNPTDAVDAPKVERAEIRALTDDEAGKVFSAAKGTQIYLPILVALTTGLRRGELLALRWTDLDLDRGVLSVQQSLEETRAGLRFKPPKTNRSRRTITLPAVTVTALRDHDKEQKAERLQLGIRGEHDDLVFSTRDRETLKPCPIRPRNVTKEFSRICKRVGVTGVTFHGLRHTHITNLLRSNVHPKIASERAGHSSVAITLDIYSHAVPNMQSDAAKLVDENIRGILGS